ncbi:MAG: 5-oxoprolinase subunit PxpA [Aurantibacter sp.]
MDSAYIDINCDLGEGLGNESELMPLISSCNIACGGHAGSKETALEVSKLASKYRVKVGAHPSYPDRENFGRVSMDIPKADLIESIQKQMDGFKSILKKENIPLNHIKAHGALYNDTAKDQVLAETFLEALDAYKKEVFLYIPYKSVIAQQADRHDFRIKFEAFADRNYNADLSLVSRKLPDAVIKDPQEVLTHLLHMVEKGLVKTSGGDKIPIRAETYCVHGDTPSALQILTYLSEKLPKANIHIKK